MTENPVEQHYANPDLGAAILAALEGMGKDIDHLTPDDLARMSQEVADLRDRVSRLEGMLAAGMALARETNPGRNRRPLPSPPDQSS